MFGLRVALIEASEMGGECLNTGCVPSKALIAAAARAHEGRGGARLGVDLGEPRVDWAGVRAHIDGAIKTIAPEDSAERFETMGVDVIRTRARFLDGTTVLAGNRRLRAPRFVIATGSRPKIARPAGPGRRFLPHQRDAFRARSPARTSSRTRCRADRLRDGAGVPTVGVAGNGGRARAAARARRPGRVRDRVGPAPPGGRHVRALLGVTRRLFGGVAGGDACGWSAADRQPPARGDRARGERRGAGPGGGGRGGGAGRDRRRCAASHEQPAHLRDRRLPAGAALHARLGVRGLFGRARRRARLAGQGRLASAAARHLHRPRARSDRPDRGGSARAVRPGRGRATGLRPQRPRGRGG